jgi:hypothetical protein
MATTKATTITPMMVKMPMPPSFHFGLGELEFHYAFTLVDVSGSD